MFHSKAKQLVQKLSNSTILDDSFSQIMDGIPAHTSEYVECRLDGNPQLDYLYCIDTQDQLSNYPIPPKDQEQIQKLVSQFPEIPYVWLEYDDINNTKGTRKTQSCWHACVYPDYLKPTKKQRSSLPPEKIIAILRHLSQDPLLGCSRLKRVVDNISKNTTLVHISYMKSRQPQAVKFFVKIPAGNIFSFLKAIQWPGNIDKLKALLKKTWLFADQSSTISLDLKWEKTLSPYLGIVFSRLNFTNDSLGAMRIASLIEEDVICDEQHIQGVLSWLGQQTQGESRWIDIKTLIDENASISSKLYFGSQNTSQAFSHRLLPSLQATHNHNRMHP